MRSLANGVCRREAVVQAMDRGYARLLGRSGMTHGAMPRVVAEAHDCLKGMACDRVTLAGLAKQSCHSPSWLTHAFHRLHGYGPLTFLRKVRMEAAQVLLAEFPYSVRAVAELVGYRSRAAFWKQYRAYWQTLPRPANRSKMAPRGRFGSTKNRARTSTSRVLLLGANRVRMGTVGSKTPRNCGRLGIIDASPGEEVRR
jgi:transcriptional regulator GlxA family with amidase domain